MGRGRVRHQEKHASGSARLLMSLRRDPLFGQPKESEPLGDWKGKVREAERLLGAIVDCDMRRLACLLAHMLAWRVGWIGVHHFSLVWSIHWHSGSGPASCSGSFAGGYCLDYQQKTETAVLGGFRNPPAETMDGISVASAHTAEFLPLLSSSVHRLWRRMRRTRGVFSRGFCCHQIPSLIKSSGHTIKVS
jgi:hypothetical protein